MTATDYHRKLNENTDAWYAEEIDFAAFREKQRALWADIEASGCKSDVLALLRGGVQVTPLEQVRARLVEDLRRAREAGHDVQAWKIKATIAGFDMALDAVREAQ